MNRKATITALVGENNAKEILKIVGTAQAKYLLTDKGKEAKRKSNANYTANRPKVESPVVKAHLGTITSSEPQTLTDLWNHYKLIYAIADKPVISRNHYKQMLDELNVTIINPHSRRGIKYYGPAYLIDQGE